MPDEHPVIRITRRSSAPAMENSPIAPQRRAP
jgi:hypothetical protein